MPPSRGDNRWIEHRRFSRTAQAVGECHIFHQGQRSEAAKGAKGFAPDEDRLVAEEAPSLPGEKARGDFEPAQARMASIEFGSARSEIHSSHCAHGFRGDRSGRGIDRDHLVEFIQQNQRRNELTEIVAVIPGRNNDAQPS